jgi:transcriptional regulator with XRE-family HTH domain
MAGQLMRDARQVRGQSPVACAAAMGVSPEQFDRYEAGADCPSLPELELLAYWLDLPVSYFWSERALSEQPGPARRALPAAELAALRHRMVGLRLRQARQAAGLSAAELAASLAVSADDLAAFEAGQAPLPLTTLEAAARRLALPLEHFLERGGPVGEADSTRRALEQVRALPPELREFLSQPANEAYLRLAHRLSELPVDKLRSLATSLLEITY